MGERERDYGMGERVRARDGREKERVERKKENLREIYSRR